MMMPKTNSRILHILFFNSKLVRAFSNENENWMFVKTKKGMAATGERSSEFFVIDLALRAMWSKNTEAEDKNTKPFQEACSYRNKESFR